MSSTPAPGKENDQLVHTDLQYVSVQIDGTTYGGWYRLMPDGQMELLALANMHSERRHESTPGEQAVGMLTDFIRSTRAKTTTQSIPAATATLGSLLYADTAKPRVPERDWAVLARSTATGDVSALHGLFQRTHHLVFTLMLRLTRDRDTAEELTLTTFETLWRRAPAYDPEEGPVLAWIMNQARSVAVRGMMFLDRSPVKHEGPRDRPGASDEIHALPPDLLWKRLAQRIAIPKSEEFSMSSIPTWDEPEWEHVAPGISCKLLATDSERDRVSMLVRLAPGTEYPPHTHAGVEELHLLHGELMIDDRKLDAGDYNRAEQGTADKRVWSETGCMCVLVTSTRDVLA